MRSAGQVDIAIIGSGLAGATYARVLSEYATGASIAIIECGPHLSDKSGMNIRNLATSAERDKALLFAQGPNSAVHQPISTYSPPATVTGETGVLERPGLFLVSSLGGGSGRFAMKSAAMTCCVGGMGVLWRGSCPRPFGSELSPLISNAEYDECIENAYRLLDIPPDGAVNPVADEISNALQWKVDIRLAPDRQVRRLPMAMCSTDGRTIWGGTDAVLGGILERSDSMVTLKANMQCRSVLVEDDHVIGVELLDLATGEAIRLNARYVALAADAFRTPQILYASGIRPPALGRYLNDHLQVTAQVRFSAPFQLAAAKAHQELSIEDGGCWIPFADGLRPYHGQVLFHINPDAAQKGGEPVLVGGVSAYGRKIISGDDRIIFSDTTRDVFNMPAMSLRYRWTAEDYRTLAHLRTAVQDIAELLGGMESDHPNIMPPGASLHYLGTTRMGSRTVDSVCDSYGRVHGIANLYVGGGGLIETATACNPGLTIVALAYRGARHLAAGIYG